MKRLHRLLGRLAYGPWYCPRCGAPYDTDAAGAAHMREAHGAS